MVVCVTRSVPDFGIVFGRKKSQADLAFFRYRLITQRLERRQHR